MGTEKVTLDANQAVADIAFKTNEAAIIYPITPSSPMGEWADAWSAKSQKNIWGTIPSVTEMQSEGGAAGAVHGALQAGVLTTTFTASQGLLLMIPNMYKIAGELTPTVFHVSARTLATHALSIFGDHSDVMSTRETGFALLASNSVQEAMDFALISQAATLDSRIPFLHFFDGFRTSHEVQKIDQISDEEIKKMINLESVLAHRSRALTPDAPVIRGTAQNPDVFFQSREAANKYYINCPSIVEAAMKRFEEVTGRSYELFQYHGAPDAEKVIVIMGSGAEAAHEAVDAMIKDGEKVGILKVRLFRPFSSEHLLNALPKSTKKIAVMERTKEPGAPGEPLYLDLITCLHEAQSNGGLPMGEMPTIVGGRYGLSSKEFTPAMVKTIFDELSQEKPKNHFTIGIQDDVTNTSLDYDTSFVTETSKFRGIFFGLGSDGTVGANKNSIKIIGNETNYNVQAYFVYDSKKAGSTTTSHLRFGKDPIRSTYLINKANFIACHQFQFLEQLDVLKYAEDGATFLLNCPHDKDTLWDNLPKKVQEAIITKNLKVYAINAIEIAKAAKLGSRINTVMQTCFFAISGILPKDEAIVKIKEAIKKTFSKKGEEVVAQNFQVVDNTLANLFEVDVPAEATGIDVPLKTVPCSAPKFVQEVTSKIMAGEGDDLPVSAFPVDGTFPTGTTKYEKRTIAQEIPVWESDLCIQCGKCAMVCPHAVIRIKAFDEKCLEGAPETFKSTKIKAVRDWGENTKFSVQISPEDCTGCSVCVQACPAKSKENPEFKALNMSELAPLKDKEKENWAFFEKLPLPDRNKLKTHTVRDSQYLEPLFEFNGACAGCGETANVRLISQLFGDRMMIANATGCSSIYGGNLPTTPWTTNAKNQGPTWSNSLFEDNAEFGLGFRLAVDKKEEQAKNYVEALKGQIGADLAEGLLNADQSKEEGINEQRARVEILLKKLETIDSEEGKNLQSLANYLVKKSVWIMGGDGWAYDIGYGGLDHVLASGKNVNILVLDTEVYSNTGGQMSKATPLGAIAKFSAAGKATPKKDLAMMAISYRNVYVARIALGANDAQAVKAIVEAEQFDGPSIVLAYTPCIAHGYNMKHTLSQQKVAVQSGYWPLYRFDPRLLESGKNPFQMDSKKPTASIREYMGFEPRFKMLTKTNPERANQFIEMAQEDVNLQWKQFQAMVNIDYTSQD